ncbi:uncharacterized protein V1516DRAFT_672175 [Lipomyces oligophaga]|uniref:uncharacterized protein n=1 Tax=Lipomyces oligophaga TaxID=45792 RepID=UPI0034CEE846
MLPRICCRISTGMLLPSNQQPPLSPPPSPSNTLSSQSSSSSSECSSASVPASSNRRQDFPGGLINRDNSCFINSIVQACASSSSLQSYLGSLLDTNPAARELFYLIERLNLNLPSPHTYTTASLISSLKSSELFSTSEQQDTHEFFLFLLDALRPGPMDKVQSLPFDGALNLRYRCLKCHDIQQPQSVGFNSIELNLPVISSLPSTLSSVSFLSRLAPPAKLEDLLSSSLRSEVISNIHCGRCSCLSALSHFNKMLAHLHSSPNPSTCRSADLDSLLRTRIAAVTDTLRKPIITDLDFEGHKLPQLVSSTKIRDSSISRLPQSLAIHINRSQFDSEHSMPRKIDTPVVFPEYLDFHKFMDSEQLPVMPQNLTFRLSSIVVHFGIHSMGHYVTFRRHNNAWFSISDSNILRVSLDSVLSQGRVTMLFYDYDVSCESSTTASAYSAMVDTPTPCSHQFMTEPLHENPCLA